MYPRCARLIIGVFPAENDNLIHIKGEYSEKRLRWRWIKRRLPDE
jgi:hypothetical protein